MAVPNHAYQTSWAQTHAICGEPVGDERKGEHSAIPLWQHQGIFVFTFFAKIKYIIMICKLIVKVSFLSC